MVLVDNPLHSRDAARRELHDRDSPASGADDDDTPFNQEGDYLLLQYVKGPWRRHGPPPAIAVPHDAPAALARKLPCGGLVVDRADRLSRRRECGVVRSHQDLGEERREEA